MWLHHMMYFVILQDVVTTWSRDAMSRHANTQSHCTNGYLRNCLEFATVHSMEELVSSLKAGKAKGAKGPDGLAPQFLKNLGRWPDALCWTPSTSLGEKGFDHNLGEMR
jgi:hypothetical protein